MQVWRPLLQVQRFQSSPAPKGGCCAGRASPPRTTPLVSILTGPEGPVLHAGDAELDEPLLVSILTGPEGPVLQARLRQLRVHPGVSILTGPEGPVLPWATAFS